jgi:sialate O-acetylesterase
MRIFAMKVYLLVLLGLLAAVITASATDLRLAQPFQDHMVLQRQMPLPIWGWADPKKTITVKLGDQSATATSDDVGYWCAKLPAMEANATGQIVTVTDGTKTITLNDVLIGEVWFCAGQSNMARTLKGEMLENPQAPKEFYTGDVNYPLVRFINYPNNASATPLAELDPTVDGKAVWEAVGPTTAGDSMCMAFFFGRSLYQDLQVPVGLVQIAVSGTTQTAWVPKDVLDAVKADGVRTYTYDDCFAAAEKSLAGGKDPVKSWADFETAMTAWKANPTGRAPLSIGVMDYPGVLYNALVHPLAPMAMRGVIWHQGEAGPATMYGARMVAAVNAWRKDFGTNFWFMTGTMTRFTIKGPPLVPAAESIRSGVNDQFALEPALFGPDGHGVMVGMLDLGNVGTHWQRKDEAGRRLALAAMDQVYGKPSVYMGPLLADSKIEGSTITCKFTNVGTGLKYTPSIDGISGFILVDKDKAVWATPTIQGTDTITVSDPAIPSPENLYYAYYTNPHETLFNSEGLPAYSFHLKDQPVVRGKPDFELAAPVPAQTDPKAMLNISDVHRYAYVVGFLNGHGVPGPNTIKCYIPKEWAKPAASQDGKDVPLGDLTPDAQGNRFAQVTAESNGPPVVLYDAAQTDALSSANTKRY